MGNTDGHGPTRTRQDIADSGPCGSVFVRVRPCSPTLLCGLLLIAGPLLAKEPPLSPSPPALSENVDVRVVNVETWVTDRDGRPVSGLQKEDFELRVDGKPVEITGFSAVGAPLPTPAPAGASEPDTPGVPAATAAPLHLVVYFDNAHLTLAHRAKALRDLRGFLDGLQEGDEVMVVSADPGLQVRMPFTRDRAAVESALTALGSTVPQGERAQRERSAAFRTILEIQEQNRQVGESPCSQRVAQPALSYAEATRGEVLRSISTLTLLVNSLSGLPGRKALLHVSDGLPLTPGEELFQLLADVCGGGAVTQGLPGSYDTLSENNPEDYRADRALLDAQQFSTAYDFQKLARHANVQRVTLYTLQASGLEAGASAELDSGERALQLSSVAFVQANNLRNSLQLLASETGGRAIFDTNDLRPELSRIREDFQSYYLLGFTPAPGSLDRDHLLEVAVQRPRLTVRHRRGYRDKPAAEQLVDRLYATLLYGQEENPLEAQVEIRPAERLPDGLWKVPLHLRIPLIHATFLPRDDRDLVADVRAFALTRDDAGGTSALKTFNIPMLIPAKKVAAAMQLTFSYNFFLTLKPGHYQLALGLRDENGAVTSYLRREVTVAPPPP
jgi:VWFA-related protein